MFLILYCYVCNIVILVLPDGSMYAAEHEMSLQMEGLTKPRRKRGRPPKALAETEPSVCKELQQHLKYFYSFYRYLNLITCVLTDNKREYYRDRKPRRGG